MTSASALLAQRSRGAVQIRMERQGPVTLREEGSTKCRIPRGSAEAILINTSGGLAGGDRVDIAASAGPGATLALTTQAAERVYRTLGPAAEVTVNLAAEADATLLWLPQETILFDGSALRRDLTVNLQGSSTFLAVEALAFGRAAMGETLSTASLQDRWNIRQDSKLIHMEALGLGPSWPASAATLSRSQAAATVLFVATGAGERLAGVRQVIGRSDGASVWNGKLIARLLAEDSLTLRKTLIQVLSACLGPSALPKVWTL